MTELTIAGLRALLDADTATDAPMGSIVETRDWDGDEGDRREWMRTGQEDTSWWLVDGDEDDYSDTEQLMLAGGLLSAVAVPVGLLRELLDAAAERDQLRQRVAELEAAHAAALLLAADAVKALERVRDHDSATTAEYQANARLGDPCDFCCSAGVAEVALADLRQRHGIPGQGDTTEAAAADTADSTTRPTVTDAMVQAAIDAMLDLPYEAFPGPRGQRTHRGHDGREGVRDELGGYDASCPLCRVAGSHPQVALAAREAVVAAVLGAAIAAGPSRTGTPPEPSDG